VSKYERRAMLHPCTPAHGVVAALPANFIPEACPVESRPLELLAASSPAGALSSPDQTGHLRVER
jgi:hypothetical protein